MNTEIESILAAGANEIWGLALSDAQIQQFGFYANLLVEWNRDRMNLTRLVSPRQIAVQHFLDSLALLTVTSPALGTVCLDIGTGAGFPGIALKIARPDLRVTLIDSTRKKLTFCDEVISLLRLTDIHTMHYRAEEAANDPTLAQSFDLVVARAVAPLDKLIPWCVPFVNASGRFFALKGPSVEEENRLGERAARRMGFQILKNHQLVLPESEIPIHRTIVEIVPTSPSSRL